ncbi:MAG: FAD-dependent oxidoreductase [Roseobacter sp.]
MTKSIAIVGSGPAGFYAAEALLNSKATLRVDMYERMPVPFGLVRYGVAPDHQKLKSVTAVFETIASHANFQFLGNVTIGKDVTIKELEDAYDAIVIASGAISDRKLGIPGEDLPGSVSATEFVSWYNGHPEFQNHKFDLSHPCAVVIGNGNVALDVSRILAKTPAELASSDICAQALEVLSASKVTDIIVVGRRGPLQASFSIRELREFSTLTGAQPVFNPAELDAADASPEELQTAARMIGILSGFAHPDTPRQAAKRIHFRFLLSPQKIQGTKSAESVVFARCKLEGTAFERRAVPTQNEDIIHAGLVLRSVGYRGRQLSGVPFDTSTGVIPSQQGRVTNFEGQPVAKLYVAGWIRRGPSGIIGTNRECATETAEAVLTDLDATSKLSDPALRSQLLARLDTGKQIKVDFAGWHRIDSI